MREEVLFEGRDPEGLQKLSGLAIYRPNLDTLLRVKRDGGKDFAKTREC